MTQLGILLISVVIKQARSYTVSPQKMYYNYVACSIHAANWTCAQVITQWLGTSSTKGVLATGLHHPLLALQPRSLTVVTTLSAAGLAAGRMHPPSLLQEPPLLQGSQRRQYPQLWGLQQGQKEEQVLVYPQAGRSTSSLTGTPEPLAWSALEAQWQSGDWGVQPQGCVHLSPWHWYTSEATSPEQLADLLFASAKGAWDHYLRSQDSDLQSQQLCLLPCTCIRAEGIIIGITSQIHRTFN